MYLTSSTLHNMRTSSAALAQNTTTGVIMTSASPSALLPGDQPEGTLAAEGGCVPARPSASRELAGERIPRLRAEKGEVWPAFRTEGGGMSDVRMIGPLSRD